MAISKKIFLISTISLIIILMFWGIYTLSFKKPSEQIQPDEQAVVQDPAIESSQISAITDEAIIAPILSEDGDSIKYYSKSNGKAYEIEIDGNNKRMLSDKELVGLADVFWSPDKNKVISKFSQANNQPKFFLYDYIELQGAPLKDNLDNVVWNNENKIFYKYFDQKTKERTLNMANPDGTGWNKITDISLRDISIAPIPKTGMVSFWNNPDSFTETVMQSIPVIGGEKKDLLRGKFGADYLWSQNGNNLLVSHVQEKGSSKLQLALVNSLGGEYKNLGVPTLVSKCAWSKNNKVVYYALPGSIPEGSVMPNDYTDNKFNTADTFWKIDTSSKESSRLIELGKITEKYDATNLFLNSDESILFFINRLDGKLYRMDI